MAGVPTTPAEYLAALPDDRRAALSKLRAVIRKNMPKGIKEGMQYGMIGYFVPHSVYPSGYHCDPSQPLPFASIASQKNHMGLYLMCCYGNDTERDWLVKAWKDAGCKLDMGKACIRFKSIDDVPLDVVGEAMRRQSVDAFIAQYESMIPASKRSAAGVKKKTAKKAAKKSAAKKATKKATTKSGAKRA